LSYGQVFDPGRITFM